MFKSRRRPLVIPQAEHLRLAGALAVLWGNARFIAPPLPPAALWAGIALHDRAYGPLDNISIGEVDEATWVALTRRGFYLPCANPLANVITRHHLLRLAAGQATPARLALAAEMRPVLQAQMAQHHLDEELMRRVDQITKLCDMVSFDFCFEAPAEGQVEVWANVADPAPVPVHYRIQESAITLTPWPLRVPDYEGYVVGYALEGYPDQLDGIVIPYQIRPGNKKG
jgi:hypothetical protein